MELNGTISAVITGGASGLGEATARALAKQGVRVAIFDLAARGWMNRRPALAWVSTSLMNSRAPMAGS